MLRMALRDECHQENSCHDIERDSTLQAGNCCSMAGVREARLCGAIAARFGSHTPLTPRNGGYHLEEREVGCWAVLYELPSGA